MKLNICSLTLIFALPARVNNFFIVNFASEKNIKRTMYHFNDWMTISFLISPLVIKTRKLFKQFLYRHEKSLELDIGCIFVIYTVSTFDEIKIPFDNDDINLFSPSMGSMLNQVSIVVCAKKLQTCKFNCQSLVFNLWCELMQKERIFRFFSLVKNLFNNNSLRKLKRVRCGILSSPLIY